MRRLRRLFRARRPAIAIGAIAIAVGVGVVRLGAGDAPSIDASTTGRLAVSGPVSVEAGTPWPLGVDLPEGTNVMAEVWSPWGVHRLEATVDAGIVEIPGSVMQRRGHWTASLVAGDAIGRGSVTVLPGPAVDGITPLAGPRSIVADGSDWTMVTAIPADRFGNAVADDTPVSIHVRRPDGSIDLVAASTDQLLAGVRVTAGTIAGRSTIRIGVDGATGPEVEVLEVPGPPASVDIDAPAGRLRADGRSLVRVATGPLVDAFDNPLLDGTVASMTTSGPSGVGTLTSVTIDGRAEFVLEAPPEPGTVELRVIVDGVAAPPLSLDFVADVTALPVSVRTETDGPTHLDVGPVLTGLGGFVPDGTAVVASAGDGRIVGELEAGVATLEVPETTRGELTVEVLGVRTEVVIP